MIRPKRSLMTSVTHCLGLSERPSNFTDDLLKFMKWPHVLVAQDLASKQLKKGYAAADPDKAARDWFKRQDEARYFTHRVGHGIGIKGQDPKRDSNV
jgi:Xaa-Pro aminopeptidase